MITQLAKMLFLATFFPAGSDDDDYEEYNEGAPFDLSFTTVSFEAFIDSLQQHNKKVVKSFW